MKLTATIPILSTILLATTTAQSYTELKPNFLENGSKKFAFVGLMGGSSHFNWVLSIGDELGERGHDFVFISSVSTYNLVSTPAINCVFSRMKMRAMPSLMLTSNLTPMALEVFMIDQKQQGFSKLNEAIHLYLLAL